MAGSSVTPLPSTGRDWMLRRFESIERKVAQILPSVTKSVNGIVEGLQATVNNLAATQAELVTAQGDLAATQAELSAAQTTLAELVSSQVKVVPFSATASFGLYPASTYTIETAVTVPAGGYDEFLIQVSLSAGATVTFSAGSVSIHNALEVAGTGIAIPSGSMATSGGMAVATGYRTVASGGSWSLSPGDIINIRAYVSVQGGTGTAVSSSSATVDGAAIFYKS